MRGYKRTPKKANQSGPFHAITENGKTTRLIINLEMLAAQEGYKSMEDFMLNSDILDRFNELKKRYQSVRMYKAPLPLTKGST